MNEKKQPAVPKGFLLEDKGANSSTHLGTQSHSLGTAGGHEAVTILQRNLSVTGPSQGLGLPVPQGDATNPNLAVWRMQET